MLVILNTKSLSSNHFLCPPQTYLIYMILSYNTQKQKILTTEKLKLENVWLRTNFFFFFNPSKDLIWQTGSYSA